jgi:hypothetical protein
MESQFNVIKFMNETYKKYDIKIRDKLENFICSDSFEYETDKLIKSGCTLKQAIKTVLYFYFIDACN